MKKFILLLTSILIVITCNVPLQTFAGTYMTWVAEYKNKDGEWVDVYKTKNDTYIYVVHTKDGDKYYFGGGPYGNPDPNDPNNGNGIEIPELEEILKHALGTGEQILPEEISFWLDSLFGRELTEHGFGPESFWNPWDETASISGRDSINPGDGDDEGGYIDIEKLKQEGGTGETIPGGIAEGPAWGYNGDSPADWVNSQQPTNNSDTNSDDDQSPSRPNTDDGSVKGPPEIVDPAPLLDGRN